MTKRIETIGFEDCQINGFFKFTIHTAITKTGIGLIEYSSVGAENNKTVIINFPFEKKYKIQFHCEDCN